MVPEHFWWLVETLDPPEQGGSTLSEADRRDIAEALKGNPKNGDFW